MSHKFVSKMCCASFLIGFKRKCISFLEHSVTFNPERSFVGTSVQKDNVGYNMQWLCCGLNWFKLSVC